jgi:phosphoglycolate phosphatase-like HAD superfamily hydrolase
MKLLLFDVDATLVLTGGAGLRALNRVFQRLFNVDSAMNDIAPHGKTDPAIVREIFHKKLSAIDLTEVEMSRILDAYLTFLRDEVETTNQYEVLPGIMNILEEMSSRSDVLLGLATGNIETGARIKLQRGNLNRFFAFGGYGSDSENRVALVRRAAEKAASRHGAGIPAADVVVIGDTPRDIEAGRGAGFKTVGVATGQYSVDQLRDSGADLAIRNFREDHSSFLRSTFIE